MNRKERRALRRSAQSTASLADHYRQAAAHYRAGSFVAAEQDCRNILTLFPEHPETHGLLGAVLMAQGRASDAIPHFGRVITLRPGLRAAYEDLSRAALSAGELKLAIGAASRALELDGTAQTRTLFVQCVKDVRFVADDGRIRALMQQALAEAWDRPRTLNGACVSLIKLDPVVNDGVVRANAIWPTRLPAGDVLKHYVSALGDNALLGCLLACDTIADVGLERLLTNARSAILTRAPVCEDDEQLVGFCCALARQCFINQYVFSLSEAEAQAVRHLIGRLELTLATDDLCPALWPAIIGAYVPLDTVSRAEALLDRSWPEAVRDLLNQQIGEPAEERRIVPTIKILTDVDSATSREVRRQYEESPYPCWVKAGPTGQPIILADRSPRQALDVLIAGCGTGLSAIEFARQTPRARVLGVDLSLASLSYATRMARRYGLSNVEFAQADILELAGVESEFDYIDASGVLHHLSDPWEGWRILLSRLRPGGIMQVGLYSELARKSIVAARALIESRGYRAIPEDIRRCREELMAATPGSPLGSTTQWNDFFSINECRDLLFHVKEHRITLGDVDAFLRQNGLHFAGFLADVPTFRQFAARFPDPAATTDLDRWQIFESEAPDTFAAMYQFWAQKPA